MDIIILCGYMLCVIFYLSFISLYIYFCSYCDSLPCIEEIDKHMVMLSIIKVAVLIAHYP